MANYLLALDQGTTSSRAMVVDETGGIVAVDQREFEQIFPHPGWVEHNAVEIWESQLATARGAIEKAGISAADIAGIGITNQRETTVLWDRSTGEPVANAIVWQDRRTSDFCTGLKDSHGEEVQQKTGLVVDAYFAGSKVRWLLEQDPELRRRAEAGELAFGTVDSWLVWNLSGGRLHLTDVTNACRTMLFNTETMAWDDELLDWLDVPRAVLPETRPSSEVYGETDSDLFGAAIPIAGIAGDQHAALFGQACHSAGMAKNTYGTGCFMLMNTGDVRKVSKHNLLSTLAWQIGDQVEYALEGSVFIAGAAIQWLRDQLGIIKSAPEVEALAASVDDNGGVYFVPAFAGLGAPHWDQYARGTMVGLTRGSSKAHIARATLESLAYQTAEVLHAMEADSGISLAELRVDGGASMNNLLMQFQSDLLGVPVVRPENTETTALGAAYLAGLATGVWKDRAEIRDYWSVDVRLEPATDHDKVDEQFAQWKRAVECARSWAQQANG